MQYLTVPFVLIERKASLITSFPQVLKIMPKKDWNVQKLEGKVDALSLQERFNWEKARKNKKIETNENNETRMKIMLPVSLSSVFSHKVHNVRFEKQIRIGVFQKKNKWVGRVEEILFWTFPLGIFRFFTLPLEILDKTKLQP